MTYFRTSVALLALVGSLFIAPTSQASPLDPTAKTDEVALSAIDQYAEAFNVDREAAFAATSFQDSTEGLLEDIATKYPDVYADAEFTNGREFSLTIFVKKNSDRTVIVNAVAKAEASLGVASERILFEEVPYSSAELEAFAREWGNLVEIPEEDGTMTVLDARRGVITVEVPEINQARAIELAQLIEPQIKGFALPVEISYTDEYALPAACDPPVIGWLEGGRRMYMRTSSLECGAGAICSAGFSATLDGKQGVITSAHCTGEATDDYASILWANNTEEFNSTRFYRERNNDDADAQFNREVYASSVLRAKVYLFGQTWQSITGWVWQNPVGLWVCVKGGNTAYHDGHSAAFACGTIVDNTVSPGGRNPLAFAKVHLWAGSVRGGDSGSPVFVYSTGTAKGILMGIYGGVGTVTSPDFYYNKIGSALSQLGATLATE